MGASTSPNEIRLIIGLFAEIAQRGAGMLPPSTSRPEMTRLSGSNCQVASQAARLEDLQHRIAAAMRIRYVSLGLRIVHPLAVHHEAVFVASGSQR